MRRRRRRRIWKRKNILFSGAKGKPWSLKMQSVLLLLLDRIPRWDLLDPHPRWSIPERLDLLLATDNGDSLMCHTTLQASTITQQRRWNGRRRWHGSRHLDNGVYHRENGVWSCHHNCRGTWWWRWRWQRRGLWGEAWWCQVKVRPYLSNKRNGVQSI